MFNFYIKKINDVKNSEIARILSVIAIYEEILDGGFKARAYERASRVIGSSSEELSEIYKKGGLDAILEIPGIGKGIGEKIVELITTGKAHHLEELKKKIPVNVEELSELEGVGPKTIRTLWKNLGIKNISELERAAQNHKLQELAGFGKKSEEEILRSIEFYKKHRGRFLLGEVLPLLEDIASRLEKVEGVKKVLLGGSTRRMKETVGDGDFLVASDNAKQVIEFFVSMPEVIHVYSQGTTKALVKLGNNLDADLRVIAEKSFGAASQYFTGNKEHNVALRKIAIKKGWKLNEYGLFKGEKQIAGKTEEEVYNKLGLDWIPPEMRQNIGEIELASKKSLPNLIPYGSLRGDLQMHTRWSDGTNTISEMAEAAKKYGLDYIAITDHSKRLAIAGGIDEKQLEKQAVEIDNVNKKLDGITVLKGIEVDILKNGELDFEDSILKKLDVVGASIHSSFNLPKEEQTKRLLRVIENPNVDILFHPTSRLIQKRDPCEIDLEEVFDAAKKNGTVLEIDSAVGRLDLKDDHIRLAKTRGCKFVIDSDAHSPEEFECLRLGIGQARRGQLEKNDVINTKKLDDFLKSLKG